ncbi:hypothetical protein GCM10023187_05940 [Nibrella viscosa]|uniref:Uncharacterized protein n=1 Tax=Nibrella viscosa TaxID=1084524 RepID=A0ABP8JWD7_9BACT
MHNIDRTLQEFGTPGHEMEGGYQQENYGQQELGQERGHEFGQEFAFGQDTSQETQQEQQELEMA